MPKSDTSYDNARLGKLMKNWSAITLAILIVGILIFCFIRLRMVLPSEEEVDDEELSDEAEEGDGVKMLEDGGTTTGGRGTGTGSKLSNLGPGSGRNLKSGTGGEYAINIVGPASGPGSTGKSSNKKSQPRSNLSSTSTIIGNLSSINNLVNGHTIQTNRKSMLESSD